MVITKNTSTTLPLLMVSPMLRQALATSPSMSRRSGSSVTRSSRLPLTSRLIRSQNLVMQRWLSCRMLIAIMAQWEKKTPIIITLNIRVPSQGARFSRLMTIQLLSWEPRHFTTLTSLVAAWLSRPWCRPNPLVCRGRPTASSPTLRARSITTRLTPLVKWRQRPLRSSALLVLTREVTAPCGLPTAMVCMLRTAPITTN